MDIKKLKLRKPLDVEAVKFDGTNGEEIVDWVTNHGSYGRVEAKYIVVETNACFNPEHVLKDMWVTRTDAGFDVHTTNELNEEFEAK